MGGIEMRSAMIDTIMSDVEYMDYIKRNYQPKLFWAKAHKDTIIPTKRDEDAGYDIYTRFDEDYILIKPHETKMIPTDLHCAFPSGYAMILKERGSTGTKGIGGRCGVIEGSFRGSIFVPITNHNGYAIAIIKSEFADNNHITVGKLNEHLCMNCDETIYSPVYAYPYEKAICQAIMIDLAKLKPQEIPLDELLAIDSERGQGMLGSSGK